MDKKYIILSILIILIVIGLFYYYNVYCNNNQVKIGSSTITIPEGFHVVNTTNTSVELSNGTITLLVKELNQYKDLNDMLTSYNKKYENETVKTVENSVGDIPYTKTTLTMGSTDYINYWFVKDRMCYSVHTANERVDTLEIVNKIISSTKRN